MYFTGNRDNWELGMLINYGFMIVSLICLQLAGQRCSDMEKKHQKNKQKKPKKTQNPR